MTRKDNNTERGGGAGADPRRPPQREARISDQMWNGEGRVCDGLTGEEAQQTDHLSGRERETDTIVWKKIPQFGPVFIPQRGGRAAGEESTQIYLPSAP